jgi:hypothetical protein
MARPRTPTDVLELPGAFKRNPNRLKTRNTARAICAALGPLVGAFVDAEAWLLNDIARAQVLYREASREALQFGAEIRRSDVMT